MSNTLESLRHQIESAGKLNGVVRSMKAVAASSIGQFERAVAALADYYRTVELALVAGLRQSDVDKFIDQTHQTRVVGAIVFGSDQGLVGQFNERLAEFVAKFMATMPGRKSILVVGERMQDRLSVVGLPCERMFAAPNSVAAIVPLIGQLLTTIESWSESGACTELYLFHNQSYSDAASEAVSQRVLPIDQQWYRTLSELHWPNRNLPVLLTGYQETISGLLREYLFVSVFKACAESLASENASRLAAMQRAEKNIDELLRNLNQAFHRLRQSSIDEELFDLVSGFEALPHTGRYE